MLGQSNVFFDASHHSQKITINGIIFYLEEQGKRRLQELRTKLNASGEGLSDEQLAELLLAKLKEEQTDVVYAAMVEEVLLQLRCS